MGSTSLDVSSLLPQELRSGPVTVAPMALGFSGAQVYRVDTPERSLVVKVTSGEAPLDVWRDKVAVQRLAADAGVAPRVVHVDEHYRAVACELIIDRSFPRYYGNPETRDAAIALLGRTLRRVHALPLAAGLAHRSPRQFLASIREELPSSWLPSFAATAIDARIDEEPQNGDRAFVLCHNDVNPTNLIYDGNALLLLDWENAAPNHPFYDLASAAVFLRMDDAACLQLLAAYGEPGEAVIPPAFRYHQRLAAILCGSMFLRMARRDGGRGATGGESVASTLDLGAFYQQFLSGAIDIRTAEGKWLFGLSLIKTGVA